MKEQDVKKINTTALAYLGDAVYEVAVRTYLMETGQTNVDKLHQLAVQFVRAESQAKALKTMYDKLEEQEQALVRRARNRKITSKPRNADPVIYKLATAFEAFVGYLYLQKQEERMQWFIGESIKIINNSGAAYVKRKEKSPE